MRRSWCGNAIFHKKVYDVLLHASALDLIIETEKQARLVVNGLSVLRQMGQRLNLHTDAPVKNSWLGLVLNDAQEPDRILQSRRAPDQIKELGDCP
jgi:hypothetical protein